MQPVKTVAAFHDLSSVGRCALTVVMPVISAMGVQVIPAPTAVLSAHTAFPDFVVKDLTGYLRACTDKWLEMGLTFDCVYTGYFASAAQEEIARGFMEAQPKAIRVVDPVLGDDGEMYKGMPADMPARMKTLCRGADIITPNLTEAALLTDQPYFDGEYTMARLTETLERLMALGPKRALMTGVKLDGANANAWMAEDGVTRLCAYRAVPAAYPGTGDLFTSVIAGALTRGDAFEDALPLATRYVQYTMRETLQCGTDPLLGVQLEKTLQELMR